MVEKHEVVEADGVDSDQSKECIEH